MIYLKLQWDNISSHICWFAKNLWGQMEETKLISFVQHIENNCIYY